MNNYELFWGGVFSNFHPCTVYIRGHRFNCTEQYFMAAKASMFGDEAALKTIMESNSPVVQKLTGREVKGFNSKIWDTVSRDVMFRANFAKYTQNADLQTILLATTLPFAEASPHDKIWGIGLSEKDPKAQDRSKWKGLNWLGDILTEIRNNFKIISKSS